MEVTCHGKVMAFGGYTVLKGNPCVVFAAYSPFITSIIRSEEPNTILANFVQFKDGEVKFTVKEEILKSEK